MITAQQREKESLEKINRAIDQTAAWMLELTRLKEEIQQDRGTRHLMVVK